MNTNLTLTIEQSLIEKEKEYTKGEGQSLSDIVENYFKVIIKKEEIVKSEPKPITDSLRGSFKPPKDFNSKENCMKKLFF